MMARTDNNLLIFKLARAPAIGIEFHKRREKTMMDKSFLSAAVTVANMDREEALSGGARDFDARSKG